MIGGRFNYMDIPLSHEPSQEDFITEEVTDNVSG